MARKEYMPYVPVSHCRPSHRKRWRTMYRLKEATHIPDKIKCENGSRVDGIEALCVTLSRFAYPSRYSDTVKDFGQSVPQLFLITTELWQNISIPGTAIYLIQTLDQTRISRRDLEVLAGAVAEKGAALSNCWGLVDETVCPYIPNTHAEGDVQWPYTSTRPIIQISRRCQWHDCSPVWANSGSAAWLFHATPVWAVGAAAEVLHQHRSCPYIRRPCLSIVGHTCRPRSRAVLINWSSQL